jgi:hypothetical protein
VAAGYTSLPPGHLQQHDQEVADATAKALFAALPKEPVDVRVVELPVRQRRAVKKIIRDRAGCIEQSIEV